MPKRMFESSGGGPAKRVYRKVTPVKKYSRRNYGTVNPYMPMYRVMSELQRRIHPVVMGINGRFGNIPSGGFSDGTESSNGLQFLFNAQKVQYRIGTNAFGQLGEFDNWDNFQAVYDQYRLRRVTCEIMYSANTLAQTNVQPTIGLPIMYTVVDYDDSEPLKDSSDALAYSSCKTMMLGNSSGPNNGKQYWNLNKPTTKTLVDSEQDVAVAQLKVSPWLSTDQGVVSHYGMKCFMDNTVQISEVVVGFVDFTFRLFVEFRNTK